jgi:endoglucanase
MIGQLLPALALAGLALAGVAAQPLAPAPIGQITMVHGELLRDGQPWVMKGVKLVGRVTPDSALRAGVAGRDVRAAHARFGPELPLRIKAFGADTVSIEVSQYGLDPGQPLFDPGYLPQVVEAVGLFRATGLTVMLCMQWERAAGVRGAPGHPTATTMAAWQALLGALPRDDAGLILDLFNEPSDAPSAEAFAAWQQQHEALIATVRAAGFHRQIVVASGLRGAEWLDGAPDLHDPDARLAYGVHPQLSVTQFDFAHPAGWDRAFGAFCARHTCLATEWTLARRPDEPDRTGCGGDAPVLARTLLAYLWARRMGVVGWSFDFPGTLFRADTPQVPTDFTTWAGTCQASVQPYGNGAMLQAWFLAHR